MTKFFKESAAQGDIYIRSIDSLPVGAVRVISKNGLVVVAHSETGHHHVMDADKVEMYRLPESIIDCFIVVKEETTLRHLRNFDTHEDLHHNPGVYQIHRQREHVIPWRANVPSVRTTRMIMD